MLWTTVPLDGQDCVDPAGLGTGHLYAQNALTLDDDEDLPDGKPLFWSVLRESSPLALFARTRRSSSFCNYWRLAGCVLIFRP